MGDPKETQGFLNPEYEATITSTLKEKFVGWLSSLNPFPLSAEVIDESVNDGSLFGSVGKILDVEPVSPEDPEHSASLVLFFEYRPDTYNHPVNVVGKAIKGMPDAKRLLKFWKEDSHNGVRPNVLLHDNGFYINCITIDVSKLPVELLEFVDMNRDTLAGIGLSNLRDMVELPEIIWRKKNVPQKRR